MHDSCVYAVLDWCVGIFYTQTVIVSSEGAGHIPIGLFVPAKANMSFSDSGLHAAFRKRWFSWANPAETMLASAHLLADHNIVLHALAVLTGLRRIVAARPRRRGAALRQLRPGNAAEAVSSPCASLAPGQPARPSAGDADPALYAQVTGAGGPGRSQAWKTTVHAVQTVLERTAAIRDLPVPPIIREILDDLTRGLPAPEDRWHELEKASLAEAGNSAALRPGMMSASESASPYARAHHNPARVTELLAMWCGDPKYAEIAYLTNQIEAEARLWPGGPSDGIILVSTAGTTRPRRRSRPRRRRCCGAARTPTACWRGLPRLTPEPWHSHGHC